MVSRINSSLDPYKSENLLVIPTNCDLQDLIYKIVKSKHSSGLFYKVLFLLAIFCKAGKNIPHMLYNPKYKLHG